MVNGMSPVIDLDGLSVRFGRRTILDRLQGSYSGRAVGLLGPNGAGKTTLIHTLLGFHEPTGGGARILGRDVVKERRWIKRQIGYMPENDAFIAGMSAVRFVRMMAEVSGLPAKTALERAHETLFYVGLGEARYRPLESFSLGMKQQVKLAQALVHGPRILFLDEPTNGLDPPHRQRMIRLVKEIRDSGSVTVILSSHLLKDVEECCEDVLVLKDGKIAGSCNLEEQRRENVRLVEVETSGESRAFETALAALGCQLAMASEARFKTVLPEGIDVRDIYKAAGEQNVQIRRLSFRRDSLEDIFMKAMENGTVAAGGADDGRL